MLKTLHLGSGNFITKTVNLLNLAKKSAKEIFKLIRKDGAIFCKALESEVKITRRFLDHICFNHHKDRTPEEIMERILIMPFVTTILQKGMHTITRYEHGKTFLSIEYSFQYYTLILILEKTEKNHSLLSCFKKSKKRLVSANRIGTSSP